MPDNLLKKSRPAASRSLTSRASLAAALLLCALVSASARADEPLRDPTRPYTPAERARDSSPRFVVNAIIISPERRVAIVNGRRVSVGSSIAGATVIAIGKDQLVLEIGSERITTRLNEGAMRR